MKLEKVKKNWEDIKSIEVKESTLYDDENICGTLDVMLNDGRCYPVHFSGSSYTGDEVEECLKEQYPYVESCDIDEYRVGSGYDFTWCGTDVSFKIDVQLVDGTVCTVDMGVSFEPTEEPVCDELFDVMYPDTETVETSGLSNGGKGIGVVREDCGEYYIVDIVGDTASVSTFELLYKKSISNEVIPLKVGDEVQLEYWVQTHIVLPTIYK